MRRRLPDPGDVFPFLPLAIVALWLIAVLADWIIA